MAKSFTTRLRATFSRTRTTSAPVDTKIARPISRTEAAWLLTVVGIALVSAVLASRQGWLPVGDDAVVVTRAADVVSKSPPMTGMPTSLVLETGEWTYHPGPLLFAWLAPFVLLFGRVTGGALGAAALNVVAITASWWFVRSMLGQWVGIAAGTICVLIASSFAPIYQPLNSSLSACGTFAVFSTAWAVLMRVPRSTLALVFFASITAQAHVAYAVVTLSVAVPVIGWELIRRWRAAPPFSSDVNRGEWLGTRHPELTGKIVAISTVIAVTVGLWIGPLLDRSRNIVRLIIQPTSGVPSRGPAEGLATVAGSLGKIPISFERKSPVVGFPTPTAKGIGELFTGQISVAPVIVAVVGLTLLGWVWVRGDRFIRAGSIVLTFATVGLFAGTTMLPLREPIDVQLYWARCVSLFAFLLFVIGALRMVPLRRPLAPIQSRRVTAIATIMLIVIVVSVESRSIDPKSALAPERALAQDLVAEIEDADAVNTDQPLGLVARGGVITPGAVAAEQAMFGVAAARIEADKPTRLASFWYWGKNREFSWPRSVIPTILVSPRPVPTDLPSHWTELAHVEPAETVASDFPNRLAAAVGALDKPIVLTPDAHLMLPTVVDGLLPGSCEDPIEWIENPSRFILEAPKGLVELYRAGLIAEPALPPGFHDELWAHPLTGLWAYRIESVNAWDLEFNENMVLNRIACEP